MTVEYLDAKRIQGSSTAKSSMSGANLKTYWKFNETSGDIVNVASTITSNATLGTNANLTTQNEVSGDYNKTGTPSGIGNAFEFDGTDSYAETPSANKSQFTFLHDGSDWTMTFWLKLPSSLASGDYIYDSTGGDDSQNGVTLKTDGTSGNAYVLVSQSGTNAISGVTSGAIFATDGNWHFYSIRFDAGTDWVIKRDNANAQTLSSGSSYGSGDPAQQFTIGARGGSPSGYIQQSQVAEWTVFERLLTDTEITNLYASGNGAIVSEADIVDDKATLVTAAPTKSATFDGSNDKVTAGGSAGDYNFLCGNGGGSFSIACWIKPTITHQDVWLDQNDLTTGNIGFGSRFNVSGSDKTLMAGITDGTTYNQVESTAVWTDDAWQHLCITYNGGTTTMIIYRNGVSVGSSSSIASNNSTPTHVLTIGEAGGGNDNPYEGYISDLLLTDDVLTADEISALAGGTSVSAVSPAIDNQELHYTFFTDFTDSSGQSGRNGTASGTVIGTGGGTSPINASSNLPENTIFNETDTYKQYWLQDGQWKNTYANANLLSVGGSTDPDSVISYSDASSWSSALTDYPMDVGMCVVAGNADNAQVAQGSYSSNASYKYYGATNDYSANVGSAGDGLYTGSNGAGGGEQDNMIVFGGNTGGGGAHAKDLCSGYTSASGWTTLGTLEKVYREAGGGRGTPDSAIIVCGEDENFDDYDSVENYSGASDAWVTNLTSFPFDFNNGIYFGTATEGVGGMGTRTAGHENRTYYTSNGGDTWSASSQDCTYSAYGVGCAGNSNEYGLCWAGNTGSAVNNCVDYSQASGWVASGNTFPRTDYQCRGSGNASG